jgi:dynein heavy chain
VKLVLEAVCILKGVKAIRFKDPQSGQMVDSFWEAAKKMLMEDDFLASLRNYDKDHIDTAIVKKIQAYVPQPDFQPETVLKVCGLGWGQERGCLWGRVWVDGWVGGGGGDFG